MAKNNQAKLFDSGKADSSGYSAKDIEVLEGLEPVRRRQPALECNDAAPLLQRILEFTVNLVVGIAEQRQQRLVLLGIG